MKKAAESCGGCLVLIAIAVVALVILSNVIDLPGSQASEPAPVAVSQVTAIAATAEPSSTSTPQATPTPFATATASPTPSPTPTAQVTYAACADVPTHLLRLDTKGRVAVARALVPSQPDGDADGFACGDQLEYRQAAVAAYTAAPRPTPTQTARPCPTNSEQRYIDALRTNIREIGAGSILLTGMMLELEQNPALFFSEEFMTNFMLTGAVAHGYGNSILDRSQPGSLRLIGIHERARSMARSFKDGLDGIVLGVRDLDEAAVARGARHMQATESKILEVNRLIASLCR